MTAREEPPVAAARLGWGRPATRGTIPALGEVWEPVGPTMTLLTAHLVRAAAVRPFVPDGLHIVHVLPGWTLASALLSYYGPTGTMEYHELALAGALVRHGRHVAPFVTHIYVDREDSVVGGRRMGLPKEMATFAWDGRRPGQAALTRADGVPLATIRYGGRGLDLTMRLRSPSLTTIGREVWAFRSWIRGAWGLTSAAFEVPPASPLAPLGLGKALIATSCGPMRGRMGEKMRLVGQLPGAGAASGGEPRA